MKTLALLSLSFAVVLSLSPPLGEEQSPVLTGKNQSPLLGDVLPLQGHVEVEDPAPQVRVSAKEQQEEVNQNQNMVELEVKVKPEVKMEEKSEVEQEVKAEPEVEVEAKMEPNLNVVSEAGVNPVAQNPVIEPLPEEDEGFMSKRGAVLDEEEIMKPEPEIMEEAFQDAPLMEEGPALDTMEQPVSLSGKYSPNEEAKMGVRPVEQEESEQLVMNEAGSEEESPAQLYDEPETEDQPGFDGGALMADGAQSRSRWSVCISLCLGRQARQEPTRADGGALMADGAQSRSRLSFCIGFCRYRLARQEQEEESEQLVMNEAGSEEESPAQLYDEPETEDQPGFDGGALMADGAQSRSRWSVCISLCLGRQARQEAARADGGALMADGAQSRSHLSFCIGFCRYRLARQEQEEESEQLVMNEAGSEEESPAQLYDEPETEDQPGFDGGALMADGAQSRSRWSVCISLCLGRQARQEAARADGGALMADGAQSRSHLSFCIGFCRYRLARQEQEEESEQLVMNEAGSEEESPAQLYDEPETEDQPGFDGGALMADGAQSRSRWSVCISLCLGRQARQEAARADGGALMADGAQSRSRLSFCIGFCRYRLARQGLDQGVATAN